MKQHLKFYIGGECVSPTDGSERREVVDPSREEVVAITNDTVYGLSGYVQYASIERVRAVARRVRAGSALINYAPVDLDSPFGGYQQFGNGREYGAFGLEEFLEMKGVVGYG